MIQFSCPKCEKKYKVGDELAGKRAKCKGCGEILAVPQADPVEITATAPTSATSPGMVVASMQSAPTRPAPEKRGPVIVPGPAGKQRQICPGCGASMGLGAVLCIACGFDVRSGKRIAGVD